MVAGPRRDRTGRVFAGMARGPGSEGASTAIREPPVGQPAARLQIEADRRGAGGERSAGARCRVVLNKTRINRQDATAARKGKSMKRNISSICGSTPSLPPVE